MADYINRRTVIKAINDLPNCYNGYSDTYDKAYIVGILVVRCKDCAYFSDHDCNLGYWAIAKHDENWYCADGVDRSEFAYE